jgi:hypothetical protein
MQKKAVFTIHFAFKYYFGDIMKRLTQYAADMDKIWFPYIRKPICHEAFHSMKKVYNTQNCLVSGLRPSSGIINTKKKKKKKHTSVSETGSVSVLR